MAKKSGLGRGLSALLSQDDMKSTKEIIVPTPIKESQVQLMAQKENHKINVKTEKLKPIKKLNIKTTVKKDLEIKIKPELKTKIKPGIAVKNSIKNEDKETFTIMSVTKLQPGKYQPRVSMAQEALNELADSIKQQGLLQPLLVREISPGNYEIIAGERRWRACQLAGINEIPVIIQKVDDEKAMILALVENLQREDLNIMEEARAMHRLITEFDLTHQQVAELLCKSRATVSNCLRLLNLNRDVRFLLESGDLDMGHARALLILDDIEQSQVAQQVVTKGLSVRETEALVTRMKEEVNRIRAQHKVNNYMPEVFKDQLETLKNNLQTEVLLKANKTGKGKIIIHYDDPVMLEKMLSRLTN